MIDNVKEKKDSKVLLKTTLIFLSLFLCIGLVTASSTFFNSSDSFLVESNYTLSPIGNGITSSSVNVSNDSWLSFSGSNEVDSIADSSSLDVTTGFTFSAWSNITSLEMTNSHYLDKFVGATGGYEIVLDNSSGQIELKYQNDTNDEFSEDICSIPTEKYGQWFNIIIRFNSTEVECYIDGVINQTTPTNGSIKTSTKDMDFGSGINGNLDEYRLYNSTLTSSEVLEIYNSGRLPNSSLPSDSLVFWVSFEEGSGLTVYDKSGFRNNGTIDGATRVNDGENLTLIEDTDYTISALGLFEIINIAYSWSSIDIDWQYVVIGPDCSDQVISLLELAVLFLSLAIVIFSIGYGIYNKTIKGLITAFIGIVIGGVLVPVTMGIINIGCLIT